MNDFVLDSVEYIRQNYDNIQENIINILFIIYIFYGFLLALDAKRRYNSKYAPFVVFSGWILFSIFFLPIYLIVRPERLTHSKRTESDQFNALILGSKLNTCTSCHEVIELDDKFCRSCGNKVLLKCPNCQQISSRNDKYCKNCGVKFKLKKDKKPKIIRDIIKWINNTTEKIEKERSKPKPKKKLKAEHKKKDSDKNTVGEKDKNKHKHNEKHKNDPKDKNKDENNDKDKNKGKDKNKEKDENKGKDKNQKNNKQETKAITKKENGDKNLPVKVGKDSFEEIRAENKEI
jgi:predicted RNA-binding Zn-ribbon protein involved in translation (DUF1610 family)